MSKIFLFLLWFALCVIQFTMSASVPTDHDAILKKVREHGDYKKIEIKRNKHREIALSEDERSQDAYCKAGNSCMPGGNVFRRIEGRYHKKRFERHTRRGVRENSKLQSIENRAINLSAAQKQEVLQSAPHQETL